MAEYTQDYVNVGGVRLHYYRTGSGEKKAILLHGATDSGMCMKSVAELIRDRYDVVMPDAQGHGLSDRLDESFTNKTHAEQVAGLARELGFTKPVLIGHSMGAGTAVNVAVLYPELPGAIVLEDGGFHSPRPEEMDTGLQRDEMVKRAQAQSQLTVDELMAQCRKNNPSWSEEEIIPWAEAKKQADINIFKAGRPGTSSDETLKNIICPTLLITSDGGMISDETARHAADIWTADKPLRWVKINGAGHNIRREQYKAFSEALLSFLDNL